MGRSTADADVTGCGVLADGGRRCFFHSYRVGFNMQIKLDSSDMAAAVLEYVEERVRIPEGYKLDLSTSSFFTGVTVYMDKIEELELEDTDTIFATPAQYRRGLTDD